MIALLQRVREARVDTGGRIAGQIGRGLLVFLGIETIDDESDVDWLTKKIPKMRLFADAAGLMNRSVLEIGGQILVVSQFTLHASTKKGNRPSFIRAARPDIAIPLYETFLRQLEEQLGAGRVAAGEFGADMQVRLVNDGPVTISIDSRNRQ